MAIQLSRSQKTFVDFSLTFNPHPLTGDITLLRDDRAINASLKNIIMTMAGERPFDRYFGSNVVSSLFEMCDEVTGNEIMLEIERAIEFNEPRVKLESVKVTPNTVENQYAVRIQYKIIGYEQVFSVEQILTPTS